MKPRSKWHDVRTSAATAGLVLVGLALTSFNDGSFIDDEAALKGEG